MAFPAPLTSLSNPRIRRAAALRRRAQREDRHAFLIEGRRELDRAIQNGVRPETLFFSRDLFDRDPDLRAWLHALQDTGLCCLPCTESVFKKIACRDDTEGVLAVAPIPRTPLETLSSLPAPRLVMVADRIEKPGNLGAILRCADGAGAQAVIVSDPRTDPFNPNVVRASIGALFCLPVVCASRTETLAMLRRLNLRILAATPHAETIYTDVDMTGGVALVLGSEQAGLDPGWLAQTDLRVRIPMRGQGDSLNVATAAALLLYECVRQRGGGFRLPFQPGAGTAVAAGENGASSSSASARKYPS